MKIIITENQLKKLLLENDFNKIFNDYYEKMLYGVCMKYTKDLDKAQDFCQNGFIKVYNNLNKYDETGSLEGWVRRVINNSILDELRKKKMTFVDTDNEGFDFSRYDSGEEEYEEDEKLSMDDVMVGLDQLSPTYKKIFKMFYLDGLSHEEISKKLGISVGTSKSNLFKAKKNIKKYLSEEIEPSNKAIENICDSKKFCKAQGKITFGQLRELVESAKTKRLLLNIGEGGYKATIRLLPWFLPQLAIAGFTGSLLRAFNKIFKPSLEETTNYKTWWGKTITKIFNLVEGELNINDPLSKIFFISDGLMTLLSEKEKLKFARYIAEVASEKSDNEEVPEYFVENELRTWLNEKFLLDPPLELKKVNSEKEIDSED